jgi:DNA-binding PadR family transcriptional regulator
MRGFESSLPIALLRARQATAHKFKRHTDAEGLTQPQWRVIRLIKGLQDRGLVETLAGTDARRRVLALTPEGGRLFERIAVISEAVYRDIEAVYGREDLARLVEMLVRLREVAEGLPDLPRVMPELP